MYHILTFKKHQKMGHFKRKVGRNKPTRYLYNSKRLHNLCLIANDIRAINYDLDLDKLHDLRVGMDNDLHKEYIRKELKKRAGLIAG